MLRLQRLAGNAAVSTALRSTVVQRQLSIGGSPGDVVKMLALLGRASGLTLTRDAKGRVTIGGVAGAPRSAELARRLRAILTDTGRVAQVELVGAKEQGIWHGRFPADEGKRVQQLRLDQILALEQGVPGAGVATLAHELIENFEAQAVPAADFDEAFDRSHPAALAAEDIILAELQQAGGVAPSGARLNTYVLDRTTVADRRAGKSRMLHVEAHRNDFIVYELTTVRGNETMKVSRRSAVPLGTIRVGGFARRTTDRPKGAASVLQPIANVLSAQPTASVILKPVATQALVSAGPLWAAVVMDHVRELMTDDLILRSERRFQHDAPTVGVANEVEVVVRRPDLP